MNNSIVFKCNNKDIDLLNDKSIRFSFFNRENKHYLQKSITSLGSDFLILGLAASYADRNTTRKGSFNDWTRNIKLVVPVLEYDNWRKCKTLLDDILSFLTGDFWDVQFTSRECTTTETKFKKRNNRIHTSPISKNTKIDLCMFSGGLDSFIGAIDLLSSPHEGKDYIFINIHGGGNSLEKDFNNAKHALREYFENKTMDAYFKTFNASPGKAHEDSTRGRSFMFFTHAIALSTCFNNVEKLIIPENGTISLNVPLTPGRFASSSTRTTHPFYIYKLQELIDNLGLTIKLHNPYQFFTKGEMILNCKNQTLLKENINKTMSCSHSTIDRYKHDGISKHCGYCLPCLIRKAAEIKAYDRTITEYPDNIDDTYSKQSTFRCLNLKLLSIENQNVVSEVLKNGQLPSDLQKYCDLYTRSMEELKNMLDKENNNQ